ncbi:MAG: hypothetical protein RMI56_00820 [Sulfolobales archaeon]|nr:hypothetical protein [Sulfolobales archaeon]MDW8082322.1 hypothetical protein [Sulfolobales archaeon]
MKRVSLALLCSAIMVLVSLVLILAISKMVAVAVGSIVASSVLIYLSLRRELSFGDLLLIGTIISVLGSLLLNTAYYLLWGYIRELYGIRAAIETFIMILKSGVFIYMFIVDLIVSFTSVLITISILSLIYIGE